MIVCVLAGQEEACLCLDKGQPPQTQLWWSAEFIRSPGQLLFYRSRFEALKMFYFSDTLNFLLSKFMLFCTTPPHFWLCLKILVKSQKHFSVSNFLCCVVETEKKHGLLRYILSTDIIRGH